MKIFVSLILIGFLFWSGCKSSSQKTTQGLQGKVLNVSGNQMPSPDNPKNPPQGLQTTLYIFELTNLNQVVRVDQSAFYRSVKSKLVKEVKTSGDGTYSITLPVGWYSVFVKRNAEYYANSFDEKNNIAPVQVEKGKMTYLDIKVDYDAVY